MEAPRTLTLPLGWFTDGVPPGRCPSPRHGGIFRSRGLSGLYGTLRRGVTLFLEKQIKKKDKSHRMATCERLRAQLAAHGWGLYHQRPNILGTCFLSLVVEWALPACRLPFVQLLAAARSAGCGAPFVIHGTRSAANPLLRVPPAPGLGHTHCTIFLDRVGPGSRVARGLLTNSVPSCASVPSLTKLAVVSMVPG